MQNKSQAITAHQISTLITALSEQAQVINRLAGAIEQLITEQATDEREQPPAFDLSGKPIVIR